MAMLKALTSFAIMTALFIKLAMAANFSVGGQPNGWDTTSNVQTWGSSQTFVVGDNLDFQYGPSHDVVEVTKGDYDNCQASSPLQTYNGGSTTVPLTAPGKRYFICGTIGHCSQGMKMEITTLATSATPPASPPTSSTPPPVASKVPAPSPKTSILPPTESTPMSSPTSSPDVPSAETPTSTPPPLGSASRRPSISLANKAMYMAGLGIIGFVIIPIASSALLIV